MRSIAVIFSAAVLAMTTGCGQIADTGSDAEPMLISGTGRHVVTGTDVRVRDASLSTVLFTASPGDVFFPTGASKSGRVNGTMYRFHEAYFERFDQTGWIADAQWVQPEGASVSSDISYAEPGSSWSITTSEDAGMGLNCREGPGTNFPIAITIRRGEIVTSHGIEYYGGKTWMNVSYTGPSGWDFNCFVRATTDRLSAVW